MFPRRLRSVSDPMSGFFLVRGLHPAELASLHPRGFKILFELVARFPHLQAAELRYTFQQRHAGESSAPAAHATTFSAAPWRSVWAGPGAPGQVRRRGDLGDRDQSCPDGAVYRSVRGLSSRLGDPRHPGIDHLELRLPGALGLPRPFARQGAAPTLLLSAVTNNVSSAFRAPLLWLRARSALSRRHAGNAPPPLRPSLRHKPNPEGSNVSRALRVPRPPRRLLHPPVPHRPAASPGGGAPALPGRDGGSEGPPARAPADGYSVCPIPNHIVVQFYVRALAQWIEIIRVNTQGSVTPGVSGQTAAQMAQAIATHAGNADAHHTPEGAQALTFRVTEPLNIDVGLHLVRDGAYFGWTRALTCNSLSETVASPIVSRASRLTSCETCSPMGPQEPPASLHNSFSVSTGTGSFHFGRSAAHELLVGTDATALDPMPLRVEKLEWVLV